MEPNNNEKFETREERKKEVAKWARIHSKSFQATLSVLDLVDVFIEKSNEFKVGKIIDKHKKGFFILLDGFGESPNEDNVGIWPNASLFAETNRQTMHFPPKDIFPLRSFTRGYTGPANRTSRPFDFSDFKNQLLR